MFYEVIMDAGETPNKCTIAPLRYRADFRIIRVNGSALLGPLNSSLLLNREGECITTLRASLDNIKGIASIDCVWNRVDGLLRKINGPWPPSVRIPDGFKTAYPRRSKQGTDPLDGLATIEAIFIAAAVLGNWDISLLSEYYFRDKFLELNKERFLELGVHQAAHLDALPPLAPRSRNSLQRRRDRGHV
jgi:pre-rRNA-processing protein TSR3